MQREIDVTMDTLRENILAVYKKIQEDKYWRENGHIVSGWGERNKDPFNLYDLFEEYRAQKEEDGWRV